MARHCEHTTKSTKGWDQLDTQTRTVCMRARACIWLFAFHLTQVISWYFPSFPPALSSLFLTYSPLSISFSHSLIAWSLIRCLSHSLSPSMNFVSSAPREKERKKDLSEYLSGAWLGLYSKGKQPATLAGAVEPYILCSAQRNSSVSSITKRRGKKIIIRRIEDKE